jgi:DNA-binding NtrC family response regulator
MSAMSPSTRLDPEELEPNAVDPDSRSCGRIFPLTDAATRAGKPTTILEARINSLKILALSLVREIEGIEDLDAAGTPGVLDLAAEVRRFEAGIIRSALLLTGGRQRRAARLLGMKATTLNTKVKRYQIKSDGSSKPEKERQAVNVKSNVKAGAVSFLSPDGGSTGSLLESCGAFS